MSKKRIRAVKVVHPCAWAAKSSSEPRKYYTWELPATAEAYEQMVEQVAKAESDYAIATCGEGQNWNDGKCARRILRAIGINPPKKGMP